MKKQTVGGILCDLIEDYVIMESSIVEVRGKNNNIKWRGRADNYPVYLDSVWCVEIVSYSPDVLIVKADF